MSKYIMDADYLKRKIERMDKKTQLVFLECSKEICLPGKCVLYKNDPPRDFWSVHYIYFGKGKLLYNGCEYKLKMGDLFIVPPNKKVQYSADEINPWNYYWIRLGGNRVTEILKYFNLSEDNLVYSFKKDYELLDAFGKLADTYYDYGVNSLRCIGYLYIILEILITGLESEHEYEITLAQRYIKETLKYISYNFANAITVKDIANNIGLSPNYLCKIFKDELGISPKHYLTKTRIDNACLYLKEPDITISKVAHQVGYRDPLFFSKEFKRFTGFTPREYKIVETASFESEIN